MTYKDLTISSNMPNGFRIPGVISGMRVFLSSTNHLGVTAGRFVSTEGDLVELPRTVRDIASFPEGSDVVLLTASTKCNGVCFRLKTLSIVDNDEIAVAMVKILKDPCVNTSDIMVTHALSSSNFACIRSLQFSSSVDGQASEYRLPMRLSNGYNIDVKVGSSIKKQGVDFTLENFSNEEGYRFTSVLFKDPPSGSRKVHVNININE